ncbi:MAG: hypothetical protein ACLUPK_02530 [Veillonella sp.]
MYVDVTLDDIILYALEHHVSDIHFDPQKVVSKFGYDKMDYYEQI